jgi:hypothetical protein
MNSNGKFRISNYGKKILALAALLSAACADQAGDIRLARASDLLGKWEFVAARVTDNVDSYVFPDRYDCLRADVPNKFWYAIEQIDINFVTLETATVTPICQGGGNISYRYNWVLRDGDEVQFLSLAGGLRVDVVSVSSTSLVLVMKDVYFQPTYTFKRKQ